MNAFAKSINPGHSAQADLDGNFVLLTNILQTVGPYYLMIHMVFHAQGRMRKVIDCIVINAVFHSISIKSLRPVHLFKLSGSSFNQCSAQYSFQASRCFPTQPLSKQRTAVKEE